jgi:hypothetical protein
MCPSVQLEADLGRRTVARWALRFAPRRVAASPRWGRGIGPVARLVRPGVRAVLDSVDLGALHAVDPPVRFGFGSAPKRPSLVHLTTVIEPSPVRE